MTLSPEISDLVQLSTPTSQSSETSVTTMETDIVTKKQTLQKKEWEYEEFKKKVETELKDFEESKTLLVMGELYRIIEDLAKEENISIVVEKASILYGQAKTDLTEKVLDRIRGK